VHVPLIFTFNINAVDKNPAVYTDFIKLISQPPNYKVGIVLCITVVTLTLIIASLAYRFIEVPAPNYFNNAFKTKAKKISLTAVEV
jgi:peptidoglycan/LPS O-acetylase OafA/YrhL